MTTRRLKAVSIDHGRIEERLSRIEAQQERLIVVTEGIADRLKRTDDDQAKVENVLHGKDATGGMIVRLDRLEQAQERTRWLTRAIVGAVVSLLVGGIWALLH